MGVVVVAVVAAAAVRLQLQLVLFAFADANNPRESMIGEGTNPNSKRKWIAS